jgi:hypothetical protein
MKKNLGKLDLNTHNPDIYALSKKIVCAVLCASEKQFI